MATETKNTTVERRLRTAADRLRDGADNLHDLARDQRETMNGGVTLTAEQVMELKRLLQKGSDAARSGASSLNYLKSSFDHLLNDAHVASGLTDW
jgi:hypothetical protein